MKYDNNDNTKRIRNTFKLKTQIINKYTIKCIKYKFVVQTRIPKCKLKYVLPFCFIYLIKKKCFLNSITKSKPAKCESCTIVYKNGKKILLY